MTLEDIKETKRYGRTDNVKTVYPPQTKFAGGIKIDWISSIQYNVYEKNQQFLNFLNSLASCSK